MTALREKIKTINDENLKLKLFEEYQREDFTRRLIIQKENSRPARIMKQKWELLKCVNSFVPKEDKSDDEDGSKGGGPTDVLKKFRKMRKKALQAGVRKPMVPDPPKSEFEKLEQLKKAM